ncbi:MAG TPA: oxidoreductase, partial [Dermatophilaceae bacterium]|nr:oxidoreductase [Dermatophilaceae bacterium]
MTRSPLVSPARPTTSYDVPPAGRAVRRARARRLHSALWWRHGCAIAGWASLVAVAGLWFWGGGARELTQLGTGLNSVGRLSGLAASDLLLLQVFLMARIPLLVRVFGQGEPARRHRLAAFSVILLLVHVLAITLGYAAMTAVGVWGTL